MVAGPDGLYTRVGNMVMTPHGTVTEMGGGANGAPNTFIFNPNRRGSASRDDSDADDGYPAYRDRSYSADDYDRPDYEYAPRRSARPGTSPVAAAPAPPRLGDGGSMVSPDGLLDCTVVGKKLACD